MADFSPKMGNGWGCHGADMGALLSLYQTIIHPFGGGNSGLEVS